MTTKHSIWNKFLRPAAGLALLLVLIACTPEMLSKIEPAAPAAAATSLPGQDVGTGPASIESQLTPTSAPPAYLAKRGVGIPTNGAPLPPVPVPANMWFYDWGATSANLANPYYLPMSFSGEDRIPAGYTGTILVFNEPDNSGQANLTPVKAAAAYKTFRANHAPARLCVGGTTMLRSVNWLTAFIAELNRQNIPLPACFHMHSYIEGDLTVSNAHAALHVVASQSPMTCPLVEYLFAKLDFYWHHFEKYPLRQQNARIVLPERSGFGIELDPSKIDKQRLVQWA